MWHPSALNNEILDLSLFSVFVCQMDLILNLPLQSYLFCFFVSVKHIIWMQQWDYFMGITLSSTIDTPQRKISVQEMHRSSCFTEKALLSSLMSRKGLCWKLVFWVYVFCLQQWFLSSPVRWSWGLPKLEVRLWLCFCWWISHSWFQVKTGFG